MAGTRGQLLTVIEAGYRIEVEERVWLAAIAEAARPLLDDDALGVFVVTYRLHDDRLDVGAASAVGLAAAALDAALAAQTRDAAVLTRLFHGPARLVSMAAELGERRTANPAHAALDDLGARDLVGASSTDATGHGVAVWSGRAAPSRIARERSWSWARAIEHLSSAFKLRRQLGTSPAIDGATPPRLFAAELVDEGAATPRRHRGPGNRAAAHEGLRDVAVALDRARNRLRPGRARRALELWRGLTAGRWCIVDRFEADGRRYLLARASDAIGRRSSGLSSLERQVLVSRAQGQALKIIAFELGLSVSTVSRMLTRAMASVGLRSTAELAALFASPP